MTLPLSIENCAVSFQTACPQVCTYIHPLCQWNAAGRSDPPLRSGTKVFCLFPTGLVSKRPGPDVSGPYTGNVGFCVISNRFVDETWPVGACPHPTQDYDGRPVTCPPLRPALRRATSPARGGFMPSPRGSPPRRTGSRSSAPRCRR